MFAPFAPKIHKNPPNPKNFLYLFTMTTTRTQKEHTAKEPAPQARQKDPLGQAGHV